MRGRVRSVRLAGALLAVLLAVVGCAPETGSNVTLVPPGERGGPVEVTGPDLDGTGTLSTSAYAGKVVVVNVWGSWCPPCKAEAADLQAASEDTAAVAQFLGITTRDRDPVPPQAFVRTRKITYPSIYDPDGKSLLAFARELPPSAIPSTMVLDREGRLAARVLGPISRITLVQLVNDTANGT